jgi:hypothetical protein
MNYSEEPKHELYFSNYCKHCSTILEQLNRAGLQDRFRYISVDKRIVKNNINYILLPNGRQFPLPPMINRVPMLLLKPNNEILSGHQILEFIKPQARSIQQEKSMIYQEPNPYAFGTDSMNSSGVMSDSFSFVESTCNINEMKLENGTAGMRQLYNYVTADGSNFNNIETSQQEHYETDKRKKMEDLTIEDLVKMRDSEFPPQKRV